MNRQEILVMPDQPTSRRQFLSHSAIATPAAALVGLSRHKSAAAEAAKGSPSITVKTPPDVRQVDVLFDPATYTAFPHVVRLDGDELLLTFRQAPRQKQLRHTHPRSVITVIRSYDLGETWDVENAGQLAAGGGQEFAPIYLGDGVVGGLLALHEVVPLNESRRSSIPHIHKDEYPYGNAGGYWCWSENFGLTWPLHQNVRFAPNLHPCSTPIRLASGTLLAPCYGNRKQGPAGISSNYVFRSLDNGKTWSGAVMITQGTSDTRDFYEPALQELVGGHLLAMHRVSGHAFFWQSESRDGGATWTEPFQTSIVSGACPRLLKLSDSRILLTYGRRSKPFGLYARLSRDGGKTWSDTSWLLRPAPNGDQGYSSSVELRPGRIFTACYAQNTNGVTGITGTFWGLPPK